MMEIRYILVLEPNWKAMAFLLQDEDYQGRLFCVRPIRRSMLRIERDAAKHYSFLRKDVPDSSLREQSLKLAAIRAESAYKE